MPRPTKNAKGNQAREPRASGDDDSVTEQSGPNIGSFCPPF